MTKKFYLSIILLIMLILCCIGGYLYVSSSKSTAINIFETNKKYRIAIITNTIQSYDMVNRTAVKVLNDLLKEHDFELIHLEAKESYEWVNIVSDMHDTNKLDLLVGTGWEASEMFPIIESKYHDLNFLVIDNKVTFSEIKSVYFSRFECSYIMGAMVATAFPHENIFGFIGNFDTAYSEIHLNGFTEGLISVNPKAKVQADYTKSYDNGALAYEIIKQQNELGIKFVMSTLSPKANVGVYTYAKEAKEAGNPIYTNCMDIDETSKEKSFIITGMIKNIELAMRIAINDIFRNGFNTQNIKLGLYENGSDVLLASTHYANYHNKNIITDKVIEVGEKTVEAIKNRHLRFANTTQ